MAGTDKSQLGKGIGENLVGPAIILIDPQLGENIGMTARAMLNCGLTDLRLVRPRDGWPSKTAINAAAGADSVLEQAHLFDTTSEAIANLNLVFAATARQRAMTKWLVTPQQAAKEISKLGANSCGVLFGSEAKGLNNDDVALSDSILMVPLNPGFSSLNLSQAVLILAYECYKLKNSRAPLEFVMQDSRPANKSEMLGLFEHLERALDQSGFFHVREKRNVMVRNLRNLLQRSSPSEQEVRTLRGVISNLTNWNQRKDYD